jgi:hypothetical protein
MQEPTMLDLLVKFNLPELPSPTEEDDTEARQLWIFRQDHERLELGYPVTYDDAREYCSREDTHGEGWFVGFDRV